jgi:hypothetical protein
MPHHLNALFLRETHKMTIAIYYNYVSFIHHVFTKLLCFTKLQINHH